MTWRCVNILLISKFTKNNEHVVTWSGEKEFTRIDKKTAPKINQTIVNPNVFRENTQGNNTRYFIKSLVTQLMRKNILLNVL